MKVKIYECPRCGCLTIKGNRSGCRRCGCRAIDFEYVGECDATQEYFNRCMRKGESTLGPDDIQGRMCADPNRERLYRKAMERMKDVISSNGTKEDIIAVMEQEIEKYRRDIRYLEKELKEKPEEVTLETGVAIEGIAVDDGIFHVSNGDTMIITTQIRYAKETICELVDKFAKYGVGCIVLEAGMDAIGVIEHEKTD